MTLAGGTLQGRVIRLEPLTPDHLEGLVAAAGDERIWEWNRLDLRARDAMERRLQELIAAAEAGTAAGYAVVLVTSGEVIGSTCYLDIDEANRATEIGATWYAVRHWGTAVNPEAKLLLMRHAFEDWGALRVWLKTDNRNERSKGAIRRLGAQPEGVLRWHMVRADGTMRDSAVFSIIKPEWPAVKAGLEARLAGQALPYGND